MAEITNERRTNADFIKVNGRDLVLGETGSVVKLKGSNFQTPRQPWQWFGDLWLPYEAEQGIAAARSLGMNVIRAAVKCDCSRFAEHFPKYLDITERYGIRVYAALNCPKPFADEGTPEDSQNLEYLSEVISLVKDDPRVFAWDLRNEPDHCGHECWQWGMEPEQGIRRSRWLARITDEIRKIDSNHPISCGMTFSYSWWTPTEAELLTDSVDFLDFHYYRRNYRESTLYEEICRVMERYDKPLLIGEVGFSSDPTYDTLGEPVHNEELQARMYSEYLADINRTDACGVLQWALTDYDLPPDGGETEYGIYRIDYSLKPAAEVFRDEYTVERLW